MLGQLFQKSSYRITSLFFVLALCLVGLLAGYWILSLEPRLNLEAETNANALAHSQAQVLTSPLSSKNDDPISVNSVVTAIDEILILTDSSTGLPFVLGVELSVDYDNLRANPGSLDIVRGNTECENCFKTDIALYSRYSHELVGVATFYSSSAFFQRLKAEVREKLFIISAIFLIIIVAVWRTTILLYEKIRKSEESVRLVFEAAPIPMFLVNRDTEEIEKRNIAAKSYLERLSLFDENSKTNPVISKLFNTVNIGDGVSDKEIAIDALEGNEQWALLSAFPIQYEHLNAVIIGITDITKRKQAELELNAIFRRFATVLEYLDASIFVSKVNSKIILFSNREYDQSNFGLTLLNHLMDFEKELTLGDSENGILNTEYQDIQSGKWYTCHSRYIHWVDGETVRLTSAIDITKLKQVQAELELAKDVAEEATQAKSEFLATMSHEIRTPLNGVLGMLQLLKRTSLSKTQKDYVEAINTSGEILLNLINELLDISKIEARRLELENEVLDLHSLVSAIVTVTQPRAKEKNLEFRVDVSENLPEKIIGDSLRIRQILMNLLGNAIKFTEHGFVELKAYLLDEGESKLHLGFDVVDSGIGIDPDVQDLLFEKFVQADTSISRKYGGTGLGLAITKNLIEAMGGNIKVRSKPGQGSSFSFDIYVDSVSDKHTELSIEHNISHPGKGLKLLIAEDVEINRKVVTGLLQEYKHQITEVTNGKEAVDAVKSGNYDLILMDIHMPEMDGIEASEIIRSLPDKDKSSTPIIALTANILKHEEDRCRAVGIDRFIVKPFTAEKLEHEIAMIIKESA